MYEEFFGLKEKPFNLTPDPRFFFLSENHRGAFEHLFYGVREKEGFILITGEVGTGKTTLCRVLIDKIESQATDCALILNPMFSGHELLQCILSDFGIQSKATGKRGRGRYQGKVPTKKELLDELNGFLLRQQAANRNTILIIDEAQNLPLQVLEEIRILSNLETEKEKLLQIILMGQIELKEKLSLPQLRQLNQRISIRYHLQTLEREEVARYIQHRLTVAGSPGDIYFTSGALREIHHYSLGIPRLINLAADRALLGGYVQQRRKIQRQTVIQGLKSLEGEVVTLSHGILRRTLTQGLAGLVIFLVGFFLAAAFLDLDRVRKKLLGAEPSHSSSRLAEVQARSGPQEGAFYTLEMGSYKTEAEALEAAERIKATGYPLFLAKRDAGDGAGDHHLYLGKFANKEEAQEAERTFRKVEGFSAAQVVLTAANLPQGAP